MIDLELVAIIVMIAFIAGIVVRDLINDLPILLCKDEEIKRKLLKRRSVVPRHSGVPPEIPRLKCEVESIKKLSEHVRHFESAGIKVRLK